MSKPIKTDKSVTQFKLVLPQCSNAHLAHIYIYMHECIYPMLLLQLCTCMGSA